MLGDFAVQANGAGQDGEWAIVGGTGEFAYAHGVVTAKEINDWREGRLWELNIRAFSLCISDVVRTLSVFPL